MYALPIAQDADETAVLPLVLQRAGQAATTARGLERAMQSWPEHSVDPILMALLNSDPLASVRRIRTHSMWLIPTAGTLGERSLNKHSMCISCRLEERCRSYS